MSRKIEISDVATVAAKIVDEYLAKNWPEVRFSLHVWRHDNPSLPTGAGDVGFTTNDVPNARRIMLEMIASIMSMEDPNAPPKTVN